MGAADFLKGILQAIGEGSLQNYNVATLGPDFRERQQRSQNETQLAGSNIEGERLKQILAQLTIDEAPNKFAREAAESEASVAESRARATELLKRPEYRGLTEEERDAKLRNIESQITTRGENVNINRGRAGTAAQNAGNYGRDVESKIADRAEDNANRGKKGGMSHSQYLAYRKAAEGKANETTQNEVPTEAEIQAAFQQLISGYANVAGPQPSVTVPGAAGAETKVFTTGPCAGKTATKTPRGTWKC